MSDARKVASFWLGPELSWVEQLSIKSFLDHGFSYDLYFYGAAPRGVPLGVNLENAELVLPFRVISPYISHPSICANLFRYKLLSRMETVWVDLDVVCLSRKFPTRGRVFGLQSPTVINNAVLGFGKDHYLGNELFDRAFETLEKAGNGWRDLMWGVTGPRLLSNYLAEKRLEATHEESSFYAVPPPSYRSLMLPRHLSIVEDRVKASLSVHLWNEFFRRSQIDMANLIPPETSYLGKLCTRHGVSPRGPKSLTYKEILKLEIHHFLNLTARNVYRLKTRLRRKF